VKIVLPVVFADCCGKHRPREQGDGVVERSNHKPKRRLITRDEFRAALDALIKEGKIVVVDGRLHVVRDDSVVTDSIGGAR
jgi:hypothetical protein